MTEKLIYMLVMMVVISIVIVNINNSIHSGYANSLEDRIAGLERVADHFCYREDITENCDKLYKGEMNAYEKTRELIGDWVTCINESCTDSEGNVWFEFGIDSQILIDNSTGFEPNE